ncbi:MAG: rubrerythrin family protein [Chloroflexi bacterium]|nr:rubrerythrin family protein [Chloroflexota bacterium]
MEFKGSGTEKNLETAFAGESQAGNRYTYFAIVAKEEGFERIAGVFLEGAENERVHAKKEFDFLKRTGDTEANLKAAVESEHRAWTEMYPEFERIAREEGFTELAEFFKKIAEIEKQHERRYLALLKNVQEKSISRKPRVVEWKCPSCGWLQEGLEAPDECPTCQHPRSGFEAFTGDYYGL